LTSPARNQLNQQKLSHREELLRVQLRQLSIHRKKIFEITLGSVRASRAVFDTLAKKTFERRRGIGD
jgi:hypothetical protein